MTMSLIQTVTVGAGGATSIEFTSIPQDATDLLLLFSTRLNVTTSRTAVRVNGDSGANYTIRNLNGNGSTVASSTEAGISGFFVTTGQSDQTANTFSNSSVYISNYTSSISKSASIDAVSENNGTVAQQYIVAGIYTPTTAISSLSLSSTSFVQYSSASLYKITKGSDGTTVVS